jgi:hypothetical protein
MRRTIPPTGFEVCVLAVVSTVIVGVLACLRAWIGALYRG